MKKRLNFIKLSPRSLQSYFYFFRRNKITKNLKKLILKFLSFFNLIQFFLKNILSSTKFFFNCLDNSSRRLNFNKESNLRLRFDKLKSHLIFKSEFIQVHTNINLVNLFFFSYMFSFLCLYNLLILVNLINFCF